MERPRSTLERNLEGSLSRQMTMTPAYPGGHFDSPKAYGSYQVVLIFIDIVLNLAMEMNSMKPLTVLIFFVVQALGTITSISLYLMESTSQALQTGLKKTTLRYHQICILACLMYISLTGSLYMWALKKSWASVSDQFSFSFSPAPSVHLLPQEGTEDPPEDFIEGYENENISFVSVHEKLLSLGESGAKNSTSEYPFNIEPLWTSGYISLYIIQRTAAILYYAAYLNAIFLIINANALSLEDEDSGSEVNKLRFESTPAGKINSISFIQEKSSLNLGNQKAISSTSSTKDSRFKKVAEILTTQKSPIPGPSKFKKPSSASKKRKLNKKATENEEKKSEGRLSTPSQSDRGKRRKKKSSPKEAMYDNESDTESSD